MNTFVNLNWLKLFCAPPFNQSFYLCLLAVKFLYCPPNIKSERYELCDETQKNVLREQYDIEPFMIETISLERIFIDKVFAAEFYYIRN